jgi:hypothetical protein
MQYWALNYNTSFYQVWKLDSSSINTLSTWSQHKLVDWTASFYWPYSNCIVMCPAKTKRVGSLISVDGGVTDSEYLGLYNPLMNFKEGYYVSGGVLLIGYYKQCKRATNSCTFSVLLYHITSILHRDREAIILLYYNKISIACLREFVSTIRSFSHVISMLTP